MRLMISDKPIDFLLHVDGVTMWAQNGRNNKMKDRNEVIYEALKKAATKQGLREIHVT